MASIPVQTTYSLVAIAFGYIIFGGLLAAMLFVLDVVDTDKDVGYSQDYGQYWLGIPAFLLGIHILIAGGKTSNTLKCVRIFFSVYCFITSVLCIALEAPDWMRYLSDNRSPDTICKLAMIAVPGLQREMEQSEYYCSRRTSYAWVVGFTMLSAVLLINFSICSILIHVWLTIRDQMVYKLPDYPAFTSKRNRDVSKRNRQSNPGTSNRGFEEN